MFSVCSFVRRLLISSVFCIYSATLDPSYHGFVIGIYCTLLDEKPKMGIKSVIPRPRKRRPQPSNRSSVAIGRNKSNHTIIRLERGHKNPDTARSLSHRHWFPVEIDVGSPCKMLGAEGAYTSRGCSPNPIHGFWSFRSNT